MCHPNFVVGFGILFQLALVGCGSQSDGDLAESHRHNFGHVLVHGGHVSRHEFSFKNNLGAPIVMTQVFKSCGCVNSGCKPSIIEPGQVCTVWMEMESIVARVSKDEHILYETGVEELPVLAFTVISNFIPNEYSKPDTLLVELAPGESVSKEFEVGFFSELEVPLVDNAFRIESDNKDFVVSILDKRDEIFETVHGTVLRCQLSATAPTESRSVVPEVNQIRIIAGDRTAVLRVNYAVARPFEISPTSIVLRNRPDTTYSTTIYSRNEFRITGVTASSGDLVVTVKVVDANTKRIEVEVEAPEKLNWNESKIIVTTDCIGMRTLTIPVILTRY